MTYEEKLLAVFSRYAGQNITSQTLVEMEKVCEKEVWVHLPKVVRDSWSLHLAFSETRPGQIDLSPRQVGPLEATELEKALKQPFLDRTPPPLGGIATFSLGFSSPPEVPRDQRVDPDVQARLSTVVATSAAPAQAAPAQPAPAQPAAAEPAAGPEISARSIEANARELGIDLPPNSSLLEPFLQALTLAIAYKRRAEAAEAALAQL